MANKTGNWLTGLYRSGMAGGVGALVWMQSQFVGHNENNLRWSAHSDAHDQLLVELRGCKESIQRIEGRINDIARRNFNSNPTNRFRN